MTTDEIMALADERADMLFNGSSKEFAKRDQEFKQAVEALAKDAARWKAVKPLFRAMSLDMGGNHTWTLSHFGMLKGPSMDEAADKLIEAAQAEQT